MHEIEVRWDLSRALSSFDPPVPLNSGPAGKEGKGAMDRNERTSTQHSGYSLPAPPPPHPDWLRLFDSFFTADQNISAYPLCSLVRMPNCLGSRLTRALKWLASKGVLEPSPFPSCICRLIWSTLFPHHPSHPPLRCQWLQTGRIVCLYLKCSVQPACSSPRSVV